MKTHTKNLKYWLLFFIGMLGIVMVMSQTCTNSWRENPKVTITYKNIRCYINGTLQILKGRKNEILEPFIYSEKIYVPVDPVANKIGYCTKWDNEKEALSIYRLDYYEEEKEVTTFIPLIDASSVEKKVEVKNINGPVYINGKLFNTIEPSEVLIIENNIYITLKIAEAAFDKAAIYSEDTMSVYFQGYESISKPWLDTQQPITYEKLEKLLNRWEQEYDFIEVKSIGKSSEGRELYSVIINAEEAPTSKEKLLLLGGIHSREDYSVVLLAKMLDEMLFHYKDTGKWDEYDLKSLFSQVELHVLLLANPDGENIVHQGIEASDNYEFLKTLPDLGGDSRWWKANSKGVDLNRNFPDSNWHLREVTQPASEGFKGDFPGSEVETQAIIDYCDDNNFIMAISYHTSGNSVFWADRGTHDCFNGIDEMLIDEFSLLTGYRKLKVSEDSSIYGGGFENWFRETYRRLSFVVELSPYPGLGYVQHPDACFDSLVWPRAKYSGVFFMSKVKELRSKMYDVYVDGEFKKSFFSKEEAEDYSSENPKCKITQQIEIQ